MSSKNKKVEIIDELYYDIPIITSKYLNEIIKIEEPKKELKKVKKLNKI